MSTADLAFVGGRIFTGRASGRAGAVAVSDGAIVAVGTDDQIRDLISSEPRSSRSAIDC